MTLDDYLATKRYERQSLIHLALLYRCEDVPSLIARDHIRSCISPAWHQRLSGWYHAGQQVYKCAICERLERWVA